MFYLDSCALVKLLLEESESAALEKFLTLHSSVPHISSRITSAELVRIVRRNGHDDQGRVIEPEELRDDLADATEIAEEIDYIDVTSAVLEQAGVFEQPFLRTLDAIHLASAQRLGNGLTAFVTYDKRLAAAAEDVGLPVVMPT